MAEIKAIVDEDDDEVVAEFPVYLSTELSKQLYILQYPDRLNGQQPYEESFQAIRGVRMKPGQEMIEVELGIKTNCPHYDKDMGKQIAVNSRSKKPAKDSENIELNEYFDKIVLKSDSRKKLASKFAVGIYKDGALHLTPVRKFLQMRPSFSYFGGGDSDGEKDKKNANEEEEEVAKPVMVKFARPENERSKRFHERSYGFLHKKRTNEPWTNLNYHPNTSQLSIRSLDKLVCKSQTEIMAEVSITPTEALPESDVVAKTESQKPKIPSDLSLLEIQALPLRDQVEALFLNGKVFNFGQLMDLLAKDVTPVAVIRTVQQVALLVQGCWVVKSDLLYPKDTVSVHSSAPAEFLCRGRDYILWKFTQNRFLRRVDIKSVTKLPKDDIQECVEGIARSAANKYWEFLLPTDSQFIEKYPDVVDRQERLWEMKFKHLLKSFRLVNNVSETKFKSDLPQEMESGEGLKSPKCRSRKRSSSSSKRSASESAGEEKPDLDVLMQAIVPSPSENPIIVKNELSSFVAEVLHSSFIVARSALRQHLDTKMAESDPGHVLGLGITDKLLEEAVLSIGGEHINKSWTKVGWTEPIYALLTVGDHLDVWRKELIGFFAKNMKARKATVKKKMELNLSLVIEESDFNKLLKDYCISQKNGVYVLKGTNPLT